MKKKLSDLANILRSKNAGPYTLTVDFLFNDKSVYEKIKDSGSLNENDIAKFYKVNPDSVKIYYFDKASGIKVTIPRKISSGSSSDTDVYGAQQHMPLMDITVDI